MSNTKSADKDRVSAKALVVWLTALGVYIVAITGRTSLGVAGVEALDRFHINASQLAVFTAVQVGVYALSQIPSGIMIDRIGAKKSMVAGAIVMAIGQAILALTTSYPLAIIARVFIGAGDATAFLGAMRLLPAWFPLRKTPLFTQLTAGLGQLGQFLSAVPFLALLHASGWTPAFISLTAAGALIALCALIAIADEPVSDSKEPTGAKESIAPKAASRSEEESSMSIAQTLAIVTRHPVCWQGFFTHWTGLMHQAIFTMLWGMPLMTLGLGLAPAHAGMALVINTIAVIVTGPLMGMISARTGQKRFYVTAAIACADMLLWVVLFSNSTPPGLGAIIALNIGLGALAPMSNLGFDSVREHVDRKVLATGTGLANMGGFIATMIAAEAVGILLDHHAHGASYGWADFRFAWLAVFAIWIFGITGLVISQFAVRSRLAKRREKTVLT